MTAPPRPDPIAARKEWMGLLARAEPARLAGLMPEPPDHAVIRPAETGTVMVEGRMGGQGGRFNLGEMTVTRCSVRLATGEVGHAYVQGRDKTHARLSAITDALMQTGAAPEIAATVLAPLLREEAARKTDRAAKAAATKVEFFTMVRGEDK